MNEHASLDRGDGRSARITGKLTLDTVRSLYDQALRGEMPKAVDLGGVTRVDSSGLALLLEWESASGGQLAIEGTPADLMRLARLCGAEELLALDGRQPGGAKGD